MRCQLCGYDQEQAREQKYALLDEYEADSGVRKAFENMGDTECAACEIHRWAEDQVVGMYLRKGGATARRVGRVCRRSFVCKST